jgi:hypothetical protein
VEFQVLLIGLFSALFVGKLKARMRFTHICSQDHIVWYVLWTWKQKRKGWSSPHAEFDPLYG